MSSPSPASAHRKAVLGSTSNFWQHHSQHGFDLTHPDTPSSSLPGPKYTLKTTESSITIDPSKSALLIIDMQNFFLSEALGRSKGAGHAACDQLVKNAIPAARKSGIRVVWLNWGLTEQELKDMPPAVTRAFGFAAIPTDAAFKDGEAAFGQHEGSVSVDRFGDVRGGDGPTYCGLGTHGGTLTLKDGSGIDSGRLLMRDTWNAALYPPLDTTYKEGSQLEHLPDVWIHKNRMSGMWGAKTDCEEFLENEGIRTLFFAGVNTDQCVGGSLTDAFSKGYDCILLNDGCGTTSPGFAQQAWEYNVSRTFGFCMSCEQFAKGVGNVV